MKNIFQNKIFSLFMLGLLLTGISFLTWFAYQNNQAQQVDQELSAAIAQHNLAPLDPGPPQDPAQVALGQLLFFDKELSGPRDIACATCHHPLLNSGDDISLSIGVGGVGLGYERVRADTHPFIPRNAPEIFNRGSADWHTFFWDGRVQQLPDGFIENPADEDLPPGLANIVAMQAMFPVTSREEMRGRRTDPDINGKLNELAALNDNDFEEIWDKIMVRLLAIPEYVELFTAVYPDVPPEELHYLHAANALAAFQIEAFSFTDSPWDQYLAGNTAVLSDEAKQGALLFYGRANCATCHSGNLLTDQQFHNLLVPQLGPGHRENAGYDIGRGRVTDKASDAFHFRTPPLRNVAITGPWMHNGAYDSLEKVIQHHMTPLQSLQTYDPSHLSPDLAATSRQDINTVLLLTQSVDPLIDTVPDDLTAEEIADLIAFLEALTAPSSQDLTHLIPESVPSGLPVVP